MRILIQLLTALLIMAACVCKAQITPVGGFFDRLYFVNTLTAGPKLLHHTPTSCTLLEPDLTVFATVNYPALPPGYSYALYPIYITETLFDTDPQNFEFLIMIRDNNNNTGAAVLRQDGTILLTDTAHSLSEQYAGDLFTYRPGITNTPTGTFMVLCNSTLPPNDEPSVIYSLPGTLPCMDCFAPVQVAEIPQGAMGGSIQAFPDPASSQVTLVASGIPRASSVLLQVLATDGRIVFQRSMADTSTQLDVQSWTNGTYFARLMAPAGMLAQCSFMVQR